jgi:hypothetical protein
VDLQSAGVAQRRAKQGKKREHEDVDREGCCNTGESRRGKDGEQGAAVVQLRSVAPPPTARCTPAVDTRTWKRMPEG